MNLTEENETAENEDSEFYFESDHLALKGNKDYMALLKSIVLLQAQRTQAIKDLDKLLDCRAKAIDDPISFVAQLQNSDLPELPGPQKLAEIPHINWSQYNMLTDMRMRPQTRNGNALPQVQTKSEIEDGKVCVYQRNWSTFDFLLNILFRRFSCADEPSTRANQKLLINCGLPKSKDVWRNFL